MADPVDDRFYDRADAHIRLSNDQMGSVSRGKVSASMLYATARFNAWICANCFESGTEMTANTEERIVYFVEQYRAMLRENYEDYAGNFDNYMKRTPD